MKESGLPQMVIDQTPWYLRRSKMPIVKAKIGPKIMTLVADGAVYDLLPVKKEVKVVVSGIYITAIKSARGGLEKPQPKKASSKDFSTNKTRTYRKGCRSLRNVNRQPFFSLLYFEPVAYSPRLF